MARSGSAAGIFVAMIALAAACAARTAPPVASPLETVIASQVAADDAVVWSSARRLAWPDFQGAAPATGSEGALTAYSLQFGIVCHGADLRFDAAAVFLPHRSWVKPAVLADPDEASRTLRHEQTHFDLTEVYARRLRKYLSGVYDPCGTGQEEMRAEANAIVAREAGAQRQYDDETHHGLVKARQRAWEQQVADLLQSLSAFAEPAR